MVFVSDSRDLFGTTLLRSGQLRLERRSRSLAGYATGFALRGLSWDASWELMPIRKGGAEAKRNPSEAKMDEVKLADWREPPEMPEEIE